MRTSVLVCCAALALLGAAGGPADAEPTAREVRGSELLVKEYLERLEVPEGRIRRLRDGLLARAFPDELFFAVTYPPAAALPAPLKPANVFVVRPDGRVVLLADPEAVIEVFKAGFRAERAGRCRVAVHAALVLLRAGHPGYRFTPPAKEISVTDEGDGKLGVGRLVALEGGTGAIKVTLTLDKDCNPLRLVREVSLVPTRRAVAVAASAGAVTAARKVVDAYVVEQKLTVAAVQYLEDPALVRVVPGYLFFATPLPGATAADPANVTRNVVVVGADGKLEVLFGKTGRFGAWFNATFGPATADPRLKEGLALAVRLIQASRPGLTFGTAAPAKITTDDAGHKTVVTTVPATGPRGGKWVLTVRLMFGRKGRLVAYWRSLTPAAS
jgi:hypothetical protein